MGFIPMQLCQANLVIGETYAANTFELPPPPSAELFPQALPLANGQIRHNIFNRRSIHTQATNLPAI